MTITGLIFSILAFVVSGITAWYTTIGPAKLFGSLSCITIWRLNNGKVSPSYFLAPTLWIRNLGAQSIVIDDMKLVFKNDANEDIEGYPDSRINLKAMEDSQNFNDYSNLIRASSKFTGFSLASKEAWQSQYIFQFSKDAFEKMKGRFDVELLVRKNGKTTWKNILKQKFDFGKTPYHLQSMVQDGQLIVQTYSDSYKDRRSI